MKVILNCPEEIQIFQIGTFEIFAIRYNIDVSFKMWSSNKFI